MAASAQEFREALERMVEAVGSEPDIDPDFPDEDEEKALQAWYATMDEAVSEAKLLLAANPAPDGHPVFDHALFAWLGEDDGKMKVIMGIDGGMVVPMVSTMASRLTGKTMLRSLQAHANRDGKPMHLVRCPVERMVTSLVPLTLVPSS